MLLAPNHTHSPFWLLTSFPTSLSWANTYLFTNTPFVSFDVCLGALVCLKGFSKVCWHFLIAYYAQFLFSPWAIILGKASLHQYALTLFGFVGVHSSKNGGLPRWADSHWCVLSSTRETRGKQRSGLRQSGHCFHHEANRTELVGSCGRCSGRRGRIGCWICVGYTLTFHPSGRT